MHFNPKEKLEKLVIELEDQRANTTDFEEGLSISNLLVECYRSLHQMNWDIENRAAYEDGETPTRAQREALKEQKDRSNRRFKKILNKNHIGTWTDSDV